MPFTPQIGDIVAFGEYSKITTKALCFGKKENGDGTFDFIFVPYQEGVYEADTARAIPPYNANITAPHRPAPYVPPYVEDLHDRISEAVSRPVNDNLYQLILTIQSKILDCDNMENVHAGELPFTTQATLYQGIAVVPIQSDIPYYPGKGGDLFDPMIGSFIMAATNFDIIFSLINAPAGVSINGYGLITVNKGAALDKENNITVQAEYRGHIYRTKLYIKRGIYTPRYLGACYTPAGTQTVLIKIGTNEPIPVIANQGDWVAFVGKTEGIWENGMVMRWNGTQWEKVDPLAMSSSAMYMAAFDDLLEGAPNARFLSAIIGTIFTRRISMTKDGVIESDGFDGYMGKIPGFRLKAKDGSIEANNIKTRDMNAVNMTATNSNINDSTIGGTLIAGDAWNADGSINNPNSFGGFLALKSRYSEKVEYTVLTKNEQLYGRVSMGMDHGNTKGTIFFMGPMVKNNYETNQLHNIRRYEGSLKVAELFEFVDNNMYSLGKENTPVTFVPINGNISYYFSNPGSGVDLLWHVNAVIKLVPNQYVIRGMDKSERQLAGLLTPLQFVINDTEKSPSTAHIVTISGNTILKVNFYFI